MTDEKQIEEIVKETIYQNATSLVDDIDKQNNTHHYMLYDEDIFHIAKRLKEKLPENAVITTSAVMLTKEEYDCLKKIEKAYDPFWFCAFGGCEGARKECKDTCEMSIFVQERRKTAKEVICNVKEMLKKAPIVVDYDGYGVDGIDYGYGKQSVDFCMNKLAKQYGVEVEE